MKKINKTCNLCCKDKEVADFYKGGGTFGVGNRCKDCVKRQSAERLAILISTPEGVKKERARHREKYHRLGYKEAHKPSPEKKKEIMERYKAKYPEKVSAASKTSKMKPTVLGNELHHWSYNLEHQKDVIEISTKDHNTIHRYIKYDQPLKLYRTRKGTLLDSRELHEKYIGLVLALPL